MKFKEEEISRTEFYRHVRLHQSVKFKHEKDSFDYLKAAQNELRLSRITCPLLADQVFPPRDAPRASATEGHISKVDLALKYSTIYTNSTPEPLVGRILQASSRNEDLEDIICTKALRN